MQITKDYTEEQYIGSFGKLKILKGLELNTSRNRPNKYKRYEVACDCPLETRFSILTSQLNRGTESCGKCVRIIDNMTDKLIPGDVYERLKVVGYNWKELKWEFQCQCPNNTQVFLGAKDVISGNTKSCGCLSTETSRKQAILLINARSNPNLKDVLARSIYSRRYSDGTLDYETFRPMLHEPCYYCDDIESCAITKEPSKHSYLAALSEEERTLCYNGADRLVSYVLVNGEKIKTKHDIGNLVIACNIDNEGKRDWLPERYIRHLIKVANFTQTLSPEEHRNQAKDIDASVLTIQTNASLYKTVRFCFGSNEAHYKKYADGDLNVFLYYQLSQLDCYYCGEKACNGRITNRAKNSAKSSQHFKDTGDFPHNGLDRMISYEMANGTYLLDSEGKKIKTKHNYDNLVTCCSDCNHIKSDTNYDDWCKWIIRVKAKWSNAEFAEKELARIIEHTKNFLASYKFKETDDQAIEGTEQ